MCAGGERTTVKALLERLVRVGKQQVAVEGAGGRTDLGQGQLLDSLAVNMDRARSMVPETFGVNLTFGIARDSLSWKSLYSYYHLSWIDND